MNARLSTLGARSKIMMTGILLLVSGCGQSQMDGVSVSAHHSFRQDTPGPGPYPPKNLKRGEEFSVRCSFYSHGGKKLGGHYKGKIRVVVECPEGIQVTPQEWTLEMTAGHREIFSEFTLRATAKAALGPQNVRIKATLDDGRESYFDGKLEVLGGTGQGGP
jgi:hypothetical protein